jgi:4-hydroxybenzoate polyprenyltransferase
VITGVLLGACAPERLSPPGAFEEHTARRPRRVRFCRMPAVLALLRPRQWTKNLLLFAALLFAGRLFDPVALATAALAFAAFCAAASSVYVVNDMVDAPRDRLHPDKRRRPIASGRISLGTAGVLAAGLTLAALALAFSIGPRFGAIALVYMASSHFYSFVGKNVAILDVLLVAIGFVLRAVAGALAIRVPFSDWFVLCTLFVALFIAVSKRRAELRSGEGSSASRPVIAQYSDGALTAFIVTAMAASIISYALYVQAMHERLGDAIYGMMATVPIVIGALFRYQLLVERDGAGEKPEEILLSDLPLQLAVLAFLVVALLALHGGR